jgi:negative regulator of sigma E activity
MTQHNTTGPRPKPEELSDSLHSAQSCYAGGPAGASDCEYAPRVSAYHDGETSEAEAVEVAAHVAACPACAAQLAFFCKVSNRFEAAPAHHLDSDARLRLEALGEQFTTGRHRIRPSADVRWVRRLTAAAAILFVVAAGKVIYEQKFASRDGRNATPALNPNVQIAPLPRPVSEYRPGSSQPASPGAPGGGNSSGISNTDFVVGRVPPSPPATGQAEKP